MKECCAHCLNVRDRSELLEVEPGTWRCLSWKECKAFYAKLPGWMRGVFA